MELDIVDMKIVELVDGKVKFKIEMKVVGFLKGIWLINMFIFLKVIFYFLLLRCFECVFKYFVICLWFLVFS